MSLVLNVLGNGFGQQFRVKIARFSTGSKQLQRYNGAHPAFGITSVAPLRCALACGSKE
jgi:hypothetical protein